jgi:hypothetical protein
MAGWRPWMPEHFPPVTAPYLADGSVIVETDADAGSPLDR